MKRLLFLGLLCTGLTTQAMEQKEKPLPESIKSKQLSKRRAFAGEVIKNFEKVIQNNGFTQDNQEPVLKEIINTLIQTDVSCYESLKGFCDLTATGIVALEQIGTPETDAATFHNQIYCVGYLSVLCTKIEIKQHERSAKKLKKMLKPLEEEVL